MADASFKDVPEIFEVELTECLSSRTESLSTFRELGPPDLVHVLKSTGRSGQRDLGSYHYVSGVDASSSASLAAYINSLTYNIEEEAGWFSKGTTWKVKSGCYCCFNAFSRLDVRVDVKIPGGVQAYVVDLRGERHEATPEIWQETFLSALLRAILYSDDPTYWLEAYRKLDPITNPEGELRFLQAAEALFLKGWQVGSDPEIQVATVVSNHLTAAIVKYFGDSGRFQYAANLFEKLTAKEPEVASLLAKSYLGMILHLLHVQCEFLRSKGKYDWAVKLARQAVNCAPSEFVTWEKLTECYIDLGQYENALLTLNSCPMFTYNGRDAHRSLTPARVHLPPKGTIVEILPERIKTEDDEADPALLRLPAPGLRGTWARAYALLTRLVSQIGWDELLKTRSSVFVMEEEYRMQKAHADSHIHSPSKCSLQGKADIDDDASTRGMISPAASTPDHTGQSEKPEGEPESEAESATLASTNGLPTIRISTESAREEKAAAAATTNGHEDASAAKENGMKESAGDALEKPVQAAENPEGEGGQAPSQEPFSFSNKRLCERWLDNLFMVLYEDLRVWTIFRAEVAHFKTQHVAYRKTGLEWEILGDLGIRLHHKEEAKEAYQRCLDTPRYSSKPWSKLLDMYAEEGDIQRSLQVGVRVAAYQWGEYAEMTYPTQIARCFFKLGQIHGHAKIQWSLLSMGLPEPVMKIMESYLVYGRTFKVEGYDF
uniref:Tubulin beta chain (Beta-tubulin) n=1 Tax=Ganoderma boninense TaxID=34458 RepID=A0A5K1JV60_9APHY|nr:Tubulin beta chain (Beta-tubulin) [Ganoderma boninense]